MLIIFWLIFYHSYDEKSVPVSIIHFMLQSSRRRSISQTTQGVFKTIVIECEKPMKQGVLTPGRVRLLLHRGLWTLKYFSKGTLVGTWTHQITSLQVCF
ncbi:hypothetical protein ES319_D07G234500v1 [Gossypium barbadense]|uniref:Uncharacterized protein n=1 Tax=Gossypium barbadense TaxID=3634 RepID=A0A5J5R1N5_GOSBA|nr:hypothetical protein ES319_D07G234500v1 [Gossypium barbadense]